MAKFVDVEPLLNAVYESMSGIQKELDTYNFGGPMALIVQQRERLKFRELLLAAPIVDVAPVVHGQWECGEENTYWCSICDCAVLGNGYKYCPNCGAKMDGDLDGQTDI